MGLLECFLVLPRPARSRGKQSPCPPPSSESALGKRAGTESTGGRDSKH